MQTTRCRFRLAEAHRIFGMTGHRLVFAAMYDDTIPEDRRFNKYTPSGTFSMVIDNPSVVGMFYDENGDPKLGNYYYFDISQVPAPTPLLDKADAPQPR